MGKAANSKEKPLLDIINASEGELSFELYLLRSLFNYWAVAEKLLKEQKVTVEKVLAGDREELEKALTEEIKQVYKTILSHLETGLAEHPELYNKMRPIILRAGNDAIRNIGAILKDYHTLRIAESKTVVVYKAGEDNE